MNTMVLTIPRIFLLVLLAPHQYEKEHILSFLLQIVPIENSLVGWVMETSSGQKLFLQKS